MELRQCSCCGELKPLNDFYTAKGKDGTIYIRRICKQCVYRQQLVDINKSPKRSWCITTLSNHKQKQNIIIDISLDELHEFVEDKDYCYICGKELDWSRGKKGHIQPNSPTLDRLNNSNVISVDNIQILCSECNAMKQNKSIIDLVDWCKQVIKVYGE